MTTEAPGGFPPYWQQLGYESPEACKAQGLDPFYFSYAEADWKAKEAAQKARSRKSDNGSHGPPADWVREHEEADRANGNAAANGHSPDQALFEENQSTANPSNPDRPGRPRLSESSTRRWIGKDPPKTEWAITDLLPRGMVTLLTAEGGAGKTMLEQTWCCAIAEGRDIFGRPCQTGASAGLFAEDTDGTLHARHNRICSHYGWHPEEMADWCHVASLFGHDSVLWNDGLPTRLLLELEEDLLTIEHLRLLAIDNAALIYAGDESARGEVTQFMAYLNGMADRLGAAIVLSTHKSKSTDGSALRSASGSTAWINSARHVLELSPETAEAGPKLCIIKSNCIKPGSEIQLKWTDTGVLAGLDPPTDLDQRVATSKLDREVLEAVRAGWAKGRLYSSSPRSPDRYLPEMLARSKGLKAVEVKNTMLTMLSNEVLVIVPRSKTSGEGLALASDVASQKLKTAGDDGA